MTSSTAVAFPPDTLSGERLCCDNNLCHIVALIALALSSPVALISNGRYVSNICILLNQFISSDYFKRYQQCSILFILVINEIIENNVLFSIN